MTTRNNRTIDNHTPSWEQDRLIHGYWVEQGRLLATEYPGAREREKAEEKLQALIDAGITSFVDLTEPGERTWDGTPMVPYDGLLNAEVTYMRFAIPDTSVIDDDGYDAILAHIRAEITAGKVVLAHCWGGKGRTGTVVGAWLIEEEGLGYPEVIDRMRQLRAGSRKADQSVPDSPAQHNVLRRRAQRKGA